MTLKAVLDLLQRRPVSAELRWASADPPADQIVCVVKTTRAKEFWRGVFVGVRFYLTAVVKIPVGAVCRGGMVGPHTGMVIHTDVQALFMSTEIGAPGAVSPHAPELPSWLGRSS